MSSATKAAAATAVAAVTAVPTTSIKQMISGIQIPTGNTIFYIFAAVLVIGTIIGVIVVWSKNLQFATVSNVRRITAQQKGMVDDGLSPYYKTKRGIMDETVATDEKCLINFAPLSVFQPGFLGPAYNGVYDERDGVSYALKAGARCFVLPIDYHDDPSLNQTLFHPVGAPCLLVRDQGGSIRSLNSGSIEKITQAISDMAFNDIVSVNSDPIILVLYFNRTPEPTTKDYLRFCSQVAKELSPLTSHFLGQTSEGVYNRQGRQDQLLYSPLNLFQRKVLVFANINLSLFRNTRSVGLAPFQPREDLDYLVNLRLYRQVESELGATVLAGNNEFPRGYVQPSSYFTVIPANRLQETVDTTKIRWTIVLPPYPSNPSTEVVKKMLDTYGVQCVPFFMFDFDKKNNKTNDTANLNLWKDTAWRAKPAPVRFHIPPPITAAAPSPQMNAMGGKLSTPNL